jgi:hypothetical protein
MKSCFLGCNAMLSCESIGVSEEYVAFIFLPFDPDDGGDILL